MLRALYRSSCLLLLVLSAAASAQAGQIELISQVHPRVFSDSGMGTSEARSISADGRYLAFLSEASNLVPGQIDHNVGSDVFVYDRVTGTTELVSRSAESATTTGLDSSSDPAISRDGRYVAFTSLAGDLVDGQTEDDSSHDVFLYDRVTRTTELVSHHTTISGDSWQPVISGDGRYVAFTNSGNLFLYDRSSRKNVLIRRGHSPAISADGRFVAFLSTAEGPRWEVLLYDRTSRKITLISRTTVSSNPNGPHSRRPVISADGSSVVFDSSAANVVPNQTGPAGRANLFLFHRPTGRTSLVSHASSSPTTGGDGNTASFAVSADGSFVAFTSTAKNHVDRQAEGGRRVSDAFLYSRASGRITLVSGAGGSSTVTANGPSAVRGISADGNLILFQGSATNLVQGAADGNGVSDVFLYDRRSRKAVLVSHGAASSGRVGNGESLGSILSADGKWVAFQSAATDLVSGAKDLNERADVFLDGGAAGRELASRRAPDLPSATPQGWSWVESMSADGRFVVFGSLARGLVAGQRDTKGHIDVFLRDRALGTTLLVSRSAVSPNTTGNSASYSARISADGRFVVFLSLATDLVPGPVAVPTDEAAVFLYSRETGSMLRIGGGAADFSNLPVSPAISADGSFVAFVSAATGLVAGQTDSNGDADIFLYDRAAGATTLVSRIPGSTATAGNASSTSPSLSADGRFIAFESLATNLVAGQSDPNDFETAMDAFLHDRVTGTTVLVSRAASSPQRAAEGIGPIVSADGRFVAFRSIGRELVPGQVEADEENPFTYDVFLYNRLTGVNTLVSHAPGSPLTAVGSTGPSDEYVESWRDLDLSADGRFVVFASVSETLIGEEQEPEGSDFLLQDVFLFDRETGAVTGVSERIATRAYEPKISADGRFIAFTGDEFVGYFANPIFDGNIFLYDRVTGATTQASYSSSNSCPGSSPYFKYRYSGSPVLSATGHVLAFTSTACDLVPLDLNGGPPDDPAFGDYLSDADVFVYIHP